MRNVEANSTPNIKNIAAWLCCLTIAYVRPFAFDHFVIAARVEASVHTRLVVQRAKTERSVVGER